MEFENKVVILTGATGLIGKAIAKRFADEGANLMLNGRSQEKLAHLAESIQLSSDNIKTFSSENLTFSNCKSLVEATKKYFGKIDILINNAGNYIEKPFLEHNEQDLDSQLDLNLRTPFFLTQLVAKEMLQSKGESIINIGGIQAERVNAGLPASGHAVSKAAVHALTKQVAIELAPYSIRVNCIAPGCIFEEEKRFPNFKNLHPIGYNGTPKDIAEAAIYLASERARFVTGVILPLDGGMYAT